MKKLFFCCLLLTSTISYSQEIDKVFIAPDFTLTDIHGQVWNLYDILDQGKPVIIQFIATWCQPCWHSHQTQYLQNLYNQYGPDGTDEVMIFLVEDDADTPLSALYGQGPQTFDNWVEATPFPIFDTQVLSRPYRIFGYSTTYYICPNKIARQTIGSFVPIIDAALNCPVATLPNDGYLHFDHDFVEGEGCPNSLREPRVLVCNVGVNTITSANLQLKVNGVVEQVKHFDLNIPTYGNQEVAFDPVLFGGGNDATFEYEIIQINGENDVNADHNTVSEYLYASKQTETNELLFDLWLGNSAEQSYWEMKNTHTGEVIAKGGNEDVGPNGGGLYYSPIIIPIGANTYPDYFHEVIHIPITESGCYEFSFVDARGDGLGPSSFYRGILESHGGDTLAIIGGYFTNARKILIEVTAITATQEPEGLGQLNVSPNPSSGAFQVNFRLEKAGTLNISLVNVLGQSLYTRSNQPFSGGENSFSITAEDLPNGIYLLRIDNGVGQTVRKVLINKP